MAVAVLTLLWGDAYDDQYLGYLADGIRAHTTEAVEFWCMADRRAPAPWRQLEFRHRWHRTLRKLEMFRPDVLPGRQVVYSDLDNLVVGNLDPLLSYRGSLGVRREFDQCKAAAWQSSWVMFEGGAHGDLYDRAARCDDLAKTYPVGGGRGDQLFLTRHANPDDLQALYPDALGSWKWTHGAARARASVLFCHGRPKPHEIGWKA